MSAAQFNLIAPFSELKPHLDICHLRNHTFKVFISITLVWFLFQFKLRIHQIESRIFLRLSTSSLFSN
jgi:hypothetical protein